MGEQEDYDANGLLTSRGLASWADNEDGMFYLLVGHGVDVEDLQPGLRDEVAEMIRLGEAFEAAAKAFFEKHGGAH